MKLPNSLKRVLSAQPAQPFVIPERKGDTTTIWRDGEVWRESKGRVRQLQSVPPINN